MLINRIDLKSEIYSYGKYSNETESTTTTHKHMDESHIVTQGEDRPRGYTESFLFIYNVQKQTQLKVV